MCFFQALVLLPMCGLMLSMRSSLSGGLCCVSLWVALLRPVNVVTMKTLVRFRNALVFELACKGLFAVSVLFAVFSIQGEALSVG